MSRPTTNETQVNSPPPPGQSGDESDYLRLVLPFPLPRRHIYVHPAQVTVQTSIYARASYEPRGQNR